MMTLKELRQRSGLTQAEAALECDVDLRTFQRWESGTVIPAGSNMLQLQSWAEKLRKDLGAGKIRWPWE